MIVSKTNWLGGINQLTDITKMSADQYWILLNGRTRKNGVEAVMLPLEISADLPSGAPQDIVAAGNVLIAFINGEAYYKVTDGDWEKIASFAMGSTEARVYSEVVPGSTVNFVRTASAATGTFALTDRLAASNAALVVMDGVRQPWVIFPDKSARVTQGYAAWTKDNPEYVPIANKPLFHNGVLYCVGKDLAGRETQVFRSVTGQPLNFVIAVTSAGDKISTSEMEGGAAVLAHNIGYDTLTCIANANTSEGSFIVSSTQKTVIVYPDSTRDLIYGEFQFRNQDVASIGALNQNSIVDVLGDVAVVHDTGIRSFNGILQFRYEGRNAPFSAPINSLLDGITQTAAATGSHDNYVMFAVQTVYGNGILFYDTLVSAFTALDIYPGIGQILKFASVVDNGTRYTYFMTASKIYRLFGSADRATVTLYGNEVIAPQDYNSVSITTARLTFNGVDAGGIAEAALYVDGQLANWKSAAIAPATTNESTQRSIPYDTPITQGAVAQAEFNFQDAAPQGTRAGLMVRFNTDGRLISASADVNVDTKWPLVNAIMPAEVLPAEKFIIVGDDGVGPSGFTPTEYANRVALQRYIQKQTGITNFIGTGDHAYNNGSLTDVTNNLAAFWGNVKDRCLFVPGNHDNDTDSGRAFFEYFASRRYRVVSTDYVDIFLVNTGFNSAMAQTELDNAGTLVSSIQFTWLRNALAASTKKHKWVVWHHPPVTSGTDYAPGVTQMQAIPLASWGATALFCGHSHILERLNYNGLLVLISGAGGRDLRGISATPSPYSSWAAGNITGCWTAEVTALGVLFKAVNSSGEILDRYFQAV